MNEISKKAGTIRLIKVYWSLKRVIIIFNRPLWMHFPITLERICFTSIFGAESLKAKTVRPNRIVTHDGYADPSA